MSKRKGQYLDLKDVLYVSGNKGLENKEEVVFMRPVVPLQCRSHTKLVSWMPQLISYGFSEKRFDIWWILKGMGQEGSNCGFEVEDDGGDVNRGIIVIRKTFGMGISLLRPRNVYNELLKLVNLPA